MSSITLTPQMLAVLDAATVARLQALVAIAAPTSEPQAQVLEGTGAAIAEVKTKKILSPEHLAAMKVGREAAKLKKQLSVPAPVEMAAGGASSTGTEVIVASLAPVELAPLAAVASSANKKDARKGGPTAWSDWVKKVLAENAEEIMAFKEGAEQKAGASLKWISANKGKASPEWLAFKATWAEEHKPQVQAQASDAEEVVAAPVPMAVAAPVAAPVKKRGPKP
ncbi:MAG: hypothetical protein EBS90_08755, partial [Betaproteobacteria bacterium]|nr:hypothetical protein [Betaproteobacteria bacterium]